MRLPDDPRAADVGPLLVDGIGCRPLMSMPLPRWKRHALFEDLGEIFLAGLSPYSADAGPARVCLGCAVHVMPLRAYNRDLGRHRGEEHSRSCGALPNLFDESLLRRCEMQIIAQFFLRPASGSFIGPDHVFQRPAFGHHTKHNAHRLLFAGSGDCLVTSVQNAICDIGAGNIDPRADYSPSPVPVALLLFAQATGRACAATAPTAFRFADCNIINHRVSFGKYAPVERAVAASNHYFRGRR